MSANRQKCRLNEVPRDALVSQRVEFEGSTFLESQSHRFLNRTLIIGKRRAPVSLLPGLARTLSVSIDALVGDDDDTDEPAISLRRTRRGPPSKIEQQLDAIAQLPKSEQKFVAKMLDNLLAQHQEQEATTAP